MNRNPKCVQESPQTNPWPHRLGRWSGYALGLYLCALASTLRAKVLFPEREIPPRPGGTGRIYSLWHGRMFYPAYFRRRSGASVLVSRSIDGERLAGALRILGYQAVRGSSSRGGAAALRGLLNALRAGRDVGIASDGPRGPAWKVQPGIVHLAARSGAPILPIVFGAARAKVFSSWDHFCLPFPFSRVVVVFGRAVEVPREAGASLFETKRVELEEEMLWALRSADAAAQDHPPPPRPSRVGQRLANRSETET